MPDVERVRTILRQVFQHDAAVGELLQALVTIAHVKRGLCMHAGVHRERSRNNSGKQD